MNTFSPVEMSQGLSPRLEIQVVTPELIVAARDVLLQGLGLLFELRDKTYSHFVGTPFNTSVGEHYGLVLGHFQSLVRDIRTGEINYDVWERNQRLQTEVTYASIATCDVLRALKHCTAETLAQNCRVTRSVGCTASQPARFESSVSRELAYCVGYAIHQFAIVRLICHEIVVRVPSEFGVVPSTLQHSYIVTAD
jgi:hypothetical protein